MILDCKPIINNLEQELLQMNSNENAHLNILYQGKEKNQQLYINSIIKKCNKYKINHSIFDLNDNYNDFLLHNLHYMIGKVMPVRPFTDDLNEQIKNSIRPNQDVDCFNPKDCLYSPCTAESTLEILNYHNLLHKQIVIVGRNLGKEIFNLLLANNASPTIIHSKTPIELQRKLLAQADVIVSCTGVKNFLNEVNVKCNNGNEKFIINIGLRDVSDNLYEREDLKITPKRGGVGALTSLILMKHILEDK